MTLRLGILGSSPGNGHPYSWSAICNGYDPDAMRECGFPAIPTYLARQSWPEAKLPGVAVTHVWTQDLQLSRHIAAAALIENVVDSREKMIGEIDGLLLARDDARSHRDLAEPFLRAGLPVYIDKPVALTLNDFDNLHSLEKWSGQIFSCSALRYAEELRLAEQERVDIGAFSLISATTPKYWDTYAVHLIDPLLAHYLPTDGINPKRRYARALRGNGTLLVLDWEDPGITVLLTALGDRAQAPLSFRIHGENGWRDLEFSDSFAAFRAALADFVDQVGETSSSDAKRFNRRVVEVLQMGREYGG